MKIEISVKYDKIQIFICNILHLNVKKSKLLAVHSLVSEPSGMFIIEYVMEGGNVECDYDSKEKWQTILTELAKIL